VSLDKDFVLKGLLQHNYLPTQKKDREEVPPVLSSETFSPDAAKAVSAGPRRKEKCFDGYDAVEYRLTRFNGVPRTCLLPHPKAYAELCLCISENWDKLNYVATSEVSMVRPRAHSDGRIVIMDYDASLEKTRRSLTKSFGHRFAVRTDISGCFPGIYSHAIPWATVGFAYAKANRKPSCWFNQLDEKVRWARRNETHGLAIGPATSNVVAESILSRVDEKLGAKFAYTRYVDDYSASTESEQDAQEFIRCLSEELARYKLNLNSGKTEVTALPAPSADSWSAHDAMTFLNLAVGLARMHPEGSVIKYAFKTIHRKKLEFMAGEDVVRLGLNLAFHHPVVLPVLERWLQGTVFFGTFAYGRELKTLLVEHARFRRSDAVAWILYYFNRFNLAIDADCADAVLRTRDCVSLLLLYLSGEPSHIAAVTKFANDLDRSDLYGLDEYWLLLYQLYLDHRISAPYPKEPTFDLMASAGVTFVRPTGAKTGDVSGEPEDF
jgi:hypothetical protein